MNNNNTDPTPAPPLEGRGVATAGEVNPQGTPLPLKGREWLPPEKSIRRALPSP